MSEGEIQPNPPLQRPGSAYRSCLLQRLSCGLGLRSCIVQCDLEALEIGCGLGLPGIAALAMGLRVTFSDYDATALRFAADNARANGFENFRLLQMDWRHPPADLQVPVVLASDLIYELRDVAPLVSLLKQVLRPDGVCLLTDQDRVPSYALRETLATAGSSTLPSSVSG